MPSDEPWVYVAVLDSLRDIQIDNKKAQVCRQTVRAIAQWPHKVLSPTISRELVGGMQKQISAMEEMVEPLTWHILLSPLPCLSLSCDRVCESTTCMSHAHNQIQVRVLNTNVPISA